MGKIKIKLKYEVQSNVIVWQCNIFETYET